LFNTCIMKTLKNPSASLPSSDINQSLQFHKWLAAPLWVSCRQLQSNFWMAISSFLPLGAWDMINLQ
jgi:hypothetical protein